MVVVRGWFWCEGDGGVGLRCGGEGHVMSGRWGGGCDGIYHMDRVGLGILLGFGCWFGKELRCSWFGIILFSFVRVLVNWVRLLGTDHAVYV